MSLAAAGLVLLATLVTATVSGVLGMAGGLLLMGALLLVLPAAIAFVVHGLLQLVSNGWRAFLQRRHLHWAVVGWYAAGATAAAGAVHLLAYTPSTPLTYLLLGLVPGLVWLPDRWLALDASRPPHAVAAGILVTALNLVAGVAGPLLDVFFVRTTLGRHAVVATKAGTQVLSHLAKVVVYGGLAGASGVPYGLVLAAVPLSMLGTALGGRLLDRISETSFTSWTRWVVTGIGVLYLVQAARLAAA
ncbi:MAG: TSUP family transporter [Mycobacteriales bacterium]